MICPRCDTTRPLEDFGPNKARKSGKQVYCKDCYASYYQTYRTSESFKERRKIATRKWEQLNRDKVNAKSRKWRQKNKELFNEICRSSKRKNRAYYSYLEGRRRVHKTSNGGFHTLEQWLSLKQLYNYMCLCCKQQEPFIKLSQDHIVPVSAGGTDDIDNIQPLCMSCNVRKYTNVIDYRIEVFNPDKT